MNFGIGRKIHEKLPWFKSDHPSRKQWLFSRCQFGGSDTRELWTSVSEIAESDLVRRQDLEVAMVRVGTALFGRRKKPA
jgi:hypothetical protein